MTNIVAIYGNTVPGEPNQDMIDDLDRMLGEAKSGELQAIAYCTVRDGHKSTGWVGNSGTSDSIAAAIAMLSHRYADALLRLGED